MEFDQIPAHAKAEAARWRALAADVADELAAITERSHHGALARHTLRVRHAGLLLQAEQCDGQVAELAGQ